jgi:hypothetical protein
MLAIFVKHITKPAFIICCASNAEDVHAMDEDTVPEMMYACITVLFIDTSPE